MAPAWGAIGSALTEGATGYLQGLLEPGIDEIRAERARKARSGHPLF